MGPEPLNFKWWHRYSGISMGGLGGLWWWWWWSSPGWWWCWWKWSILIDCGGGGLLFSEAFTSCVWKTFCRSWFCCSSCYILLLMFCSSSRSSCCLRWILAQVSFRSWFDLWEVPFLIFSFLHQKSPCRYVLEWRTSRRCESKGKTGLFILFPKRQFR